MGLVVKSYAKPLNPIVASVVVVPKMINASLLSCAPVQIIDQDLNVIASVPSGGSYGVVVFDGIDGGAPHTVFTNTIIGGNP